MRHSYKFAAIFGLMSLVNFNTASAAVLADYNGVYDLYYKSTSVDLTADVTLTDGTTYSIPLEFSADLVDELLPYSYGDSVVNNASLSISEYFPYMPSKIKNKLLSLIQNVSYEVIDAVNEAAIAIPDTMLIDDVSSRTNTVYATFSDVDGITAQFLLAGTLLPDTGSIDLLELYVGMIDANANFAGSGGWYISDIDVTETGTYGTVHVTGDVDLYCDNIRIE